MIGLLYLFITADFSLKYQFYFEIHTDPSSFLCGVYHWAKWGSTTASFLVSSFPLMTISVIDIIDQLKLLLPNDRFRDEALEVNVIL